MRLSRPSIVAALSLLPAAPALAQAPKPQAAQQERMEACNTEAGEKKLSGDERKSFIADCLAGKPAALDTFANPSQARRDRNGTAARPHRTTLCLKRR